jgi:hypothetical protein
MTSTTASCLSGCPPVAWLLVAWAINSAALAASPEENAPLQRALKTILAVESGSKVDARISTTWQVVAQAEFDELPLVFAALDKANPLAANWISMALDRIVETQTAGGQPLPVNVLRKTALDAARSLVTRKTAIDLLRRTDAALVESLQSQLLDDPEAELRRPAIEKGINEAKDMADSVSVDKQLNTWQRLLSVARDPDQVKVIASALKDLGREVDLADHFGYLTDWYIIGPFDNTEGRGFETAYPPESLTLHRGAELNHLLEQAPIAGKSAPVSWKHVTAKSSNGDVDLNEEIEKLRDVCAYGATAFFSDTEQQVEVRLRLQNSFKIWLNGELLMAQPVGHTGNSFDQYARVATLRQGRNVFLVKSCQVNIRGTTSFYDTWHFSVRVCDPTGGAILSTDRSQKGRGE